MAWHKGKKLTEEHRKKIALSHLGLKYTNRKKPVPFTKQHRQNLSKSIKKWWRDPKNKQRMSDIHKKRWNNKKNKKAGAPKE